MSSLFGSLVAAPLVRHARRECIGCKATESSPDGTRSFVCQNCIDKADVVIAAMREVGLR